jgi:translation initiation factor 2A
LISGSGCRTISGRLYTTSSRLTSSRLVLICGFGNLAATIYIYGWRSLNKMSTIDVSNTSRCEWVSDGKLILTAMLSPRLRVNNGIKILYLLG